jgi:hypothetical protein
MTKPDQMSILCDFKQITLQMTHMSGIIRGIKLSDMQLPVVLFVSWVQLSKTPSPITKSIQKQNLCANIPKLSLCQVSSPSCLTLMSLIINTTTVGMITN